ncbi:MAG: ATP-binding protein [Phycisphaerae bacterium]
MKTGTQSAPLISGNTEGSGIGPERILDSVGAAVMVVRRDQTIRYRNALARSWLPDGADIETVLAGARFLGRFEGWPAVLARVTDAKETVRLDCALVVPGSSRAMLARMRCEPLRGPDEQPTSDAVLLIEEGGQQDAVEAQVEVSARLASLGKLAARVAHELNNPLDGILRYINLATRVADENVNPRLKSYLSESRTGLIRMVQIISDLLEFSRTSDGEFDEMNLNEVVEQAIKSTAVRLKDHGVVVAADFQCQEMPSVCGSRIYQVCCNLIINAIDAMPDGGRLAITTGVVEGDVVIRVADSGVGLPDPPGRVFEPFFTTKEAGKGTGLGLAICRDFIEDMNGTIVAEAGAEGGAVFTVRIPLGSFRRPSPLTSPRGEANRERRDRQAR